MFILLATLCFSTTGTAQALAPAGASPMLIGAMRLWLGFLCMLLWCRVSKKPISVKGWPLGWTFVSAVGIVLYQLTFFAAVASTGVAVGTVVTCGSIPVVASILGYALLREKPPRLWYPATAGAIAGLALLSITNNAHTTPQGLGLALAAGISYAVHATFARGLTQRYDPGLVVTVLFGIGAVLITPVFFYFPLAWIGTWRGAWICLHLGLITAAMGYSLYLAGLKWTAVSTATTINLSESLLAACWGICLLGEYVTLTQLLGMALLFIFTALLALRPQ